MATNGTRSAFGPLPLVWPVTVSVYVPSCSSEVSHGQFQVSGVPGFLAAQRLLREFGLSALMPKM